MAAQLPNTQMYLITYQGSGDEIELSKLSYLTSFNPIGYNNQPSIINDTEILFTSSYNALGLTDIYKIDLSTNHLSRLTQTEESEYSPRYNPDKTISVVRQELDDSQPIPQTLWKYPADLSSFGENVIKSRSDIGYYCWLPDNKIALFIVGERNSLHIKDLENGEEKFISYNIGRCLKYDGNGGLLYVQKLGSTWMIKRKNIEEGITKTITPTLDNSEDFDILPNGDLIAAQGRALYVFNMVTKSGWQKVIDLEENNLGEISRISVDENKIIIVVRP